MSYALAEKNSTNIFPMISCGLLMLSTGGVDPSVAMINALRAPVTVPDPRSHVILSEQLKLHAESTGGYIPHSLLSNPSQVIFSFANKLISDVEDVPPEFDAVFARSYWDLLA